MKFKWFHHSHEFRWCCNLFRELTEPTTQENLRIIPVTDEDHRILFAMEFRSVLEDSEEALIAKIGKAEEKLVLTHLMFIKFCPWCGNNLAWFYKNHSFLNTRSLNEISEVDP